MAEGQIVVTGASKGIGAAIVSELSARGFSTISVSRSGDAMAGRGIACDVTDDDAVTALFADVAKDAPIIGLINNAGVHKGAPTETLPTQDFEEVMRLNATAVMFAARAAFPYLKATGGRIINIGSFFDKLGVPDNLAYCASKAAVAAMTRCLAVEWASHGITAINIAPGYIETNLNREFLARDKVRAWLEKRVPMARPGQPEEVARLVATLYSEDIAYLTGETIYLDGGQGMNH